VKLSEALEPLYRNYLRRLDEMASRIGTGALLREASTRDAEARLVRDEAGFPRRFDVADSASSETFEVHGAHPDAPAAGEVEVAGLGFRLQPGNWEELPVLCSFRIEPEADDAGALADLIRSWAVVSSAGGFAPADRGLWSGRLHSARFSLRGAGVRAVLDLGTCPPAALDSLAAALADFGRDRAPLGLVEIGGPASS
jgi:hypothetical protein